MIAKFAKKINEILIQKEIVQKEDAELYYSGGSHCKSRIG